MLNSWIINNFEVFWRTRPPGKLLYLMLKSVSLHFLLQAVYALLMLGWIFVPVYITSGVSLTIFCVVVLQCIGNYTIIIILCFYIACTRLFQVGGFSYPPPTRKRLVQASFHIVFVRIRCILSMALNHRNTRFRRTMIILLLHC